MKRIERDDEREERIDNEAIVDAHDEEERSLGWYYHAPEDPCQGSDLWLIFNLSDST